MDLTEKKLIMENFSLEEEDTNGLFITQEAREIVPLIPDFNDSDGNDMEFENSVVNQGHVENAYSDISDVDDFDVPSSQAIQQFPNGR